MILINTFKLIGLVGPNINISNRYIQLNNFLLAKTYEKCIFSHFCEKLLNLINGAITYICDCIYINLYMVFITQVSQVYFFESVFFVVFDVSVHADCNSHALPDSSQMLVLSNSSKLWWLARWIEDSLSLFHSRCQSFALLHPYRFYKVVDSTEF